MSQKKQGISYIIPCYNEEGTIGRCIQSILGLSISIPYEIIVVDNGSTDGTTQVAKRMSAVVTVMSSSAKTVSGVRNDGARAAKYSLLAFIDGDVLLDTSWFSKVQPHLEGIESGAYASGSHVLEPKEDVCYPGGWYDDAIRHMSETHINSAHFLVSEKEFWNVGGFDERLTSGEDYDISIRLKKSGVEIRNLQYLIAYHLGYPKNLREFIGREVWHGKGDLVSLAALIRSKVAIVSVLFFILHIVLVISIVANYLYLSAVSALGIYLLCLFSSFKKFRSCSIKRRLAHSNTFYFYFIGRSLSLFKR